MHFLTSISSLLWYKAYRAGILMSLNVQLDQINICLISFDRMYMQKGNTIRLFDSPIWTFMFYLKKKLYHQILYKKIKWSKKKHWYLDPAVLTSIVFCWVFFVFFRNLLSDYSISKRNNQFFVYCGRQFSDSREDKPHPLKGKWSVFKCKYHKYVYSLHNSMYCSYIGKIQ